MKLEVGSIVYSDSGERRYKVTRVTPKTAYCRLNDNYDMKFKRDLENETHFSEIGDTDVWHKKYYSVATPELDQKYKRFRMEKTLSGIDLSKVSDDQLEKALLIFLKETEGN